jgi:sulfur carrier protein ThiS
VTPDGPISHLDLELEEGSSLGRVVELLEYTDQIEHMLLAINGKIAYREDILKNGDTIRIMPAMSGGG